MSAAIRADWIRIRGRRDVWFVLAGVVGAASLLFAASFFASIGHLDDGSATSPSGQLSPEAAALRAAFAFPQSLLTILAGSWPLSLAAAYLAFATVGSEFTFGTIRPSLIVAPSRRVFLASRCLVLVGLVVAGGLALVVAGALLPAILGLVSGRMPSVPLVPATGLGVELLARMLAAGAFASVGLFFAVATRSLIGATLATLVYLLLETIVSSSTRSGGLAWIGQITVSGSTTAVIEAAHRGAGGVLPVDEVAQLALLAEPVIDPLVSLAVALGWIAALVVISLVVFERVDVTD